MGEWVRRTDGFAACRGAVMSDQQMAWGAGNSGWR